MNVYDNFMNLVRARYSCRDYDATAPVSDEEVSKVLDAARLAPSACNRQPWTFVVVRDEALRSRILAKSRPAFMNAPVLIVACGHHDAAWHRPVDDKDHTDVDVSIAVEHICLAAAALQLGTCWVCSFDVEGTRAALELPDEVEPVALIPLGRPVSGDIPTKTRKPESEIVRWGKY